MKNSWNISSERIQIVLSSINAVWYKFKPVKLIMKYKTRVIDKKTNLMQIIAAINTS